MFKIQAANRMQVAYKTKVKTEEREFKAPKAGDSIEFMSDMFTDKGPCSGSVTRSFVTVDGPYITAEVSDGQVTLSWDALAPFARQRSKDSWVIEKSKVEAFTKKLKADLRQT